jgi:uncharacterized protein YrrD
MNITVNAEIVCTDGYYGHLNSVILNPAKPQVTHLVVQRDGLFSHAWLVPVAHIVDSTPDHIQLDLSAKEITDRMLPFIRTEFLAPDSPDVLYKTDLMWPHLIANLEMKTIEHENLPLNELAVHKEAVVEAKDGALGYLESIILNPRNHYIDQIVVRAGHWHGNARRVIPAVAIDRFGEDAIHLSISKHEAEALTPMWQNRG